MDAILERLNRWTAWVQDPSDAVATLAKGHHIYRGLRSMIEANRQLDGPSAFYLWFTNNYAVAQAVAIRRLIDERSDVSSLYRLLLEIEKHITRADCRLLYPVRLRGDGDAVFDRLAGRGASSFPTKAADRDLKALEGLRDPIGKFVNKKVAHLALDRGKLANPRLSDLDRAVDTIVRIYPLPGAPRPRAARLPGSELSA